MPTSKRPSSRAAESEPDPKRVETDQTNNTTNDNDSGSETPDEATLEALENEFEPYEYVCLNIPPYGRDTDEDDEDQDPEENSDDDLHKKPASEHPDHKFIIPWSAFKKYHDYCRFATYVDPDAFDMYIYNDYQAYGTIQLVENALHDLDKAVKAKTTKQIWSETAFLAYFLNHPLADQWPLADDGERVENLCSLIGCAILTALNVVDEADQLKKDSEYRDLGLVMALYIHQSEISGPDMEYSYIKSIMQYAKKAGIDLVKDSGVWGLEAFVADLGSVEALEGEAKDNRWDWKKTYKTYMDKHRGEPAGAFTFNILTMSRAKRAEHAFNKKDPLAQFSVKDLKEGNVMLQ